MEHKEFDNEKSLMDEVLCNSLLISVAYVSFAD